MNSKNVVIVGATGLVGSTLISLLEEKSFPIKNIFFLASRQSVGNVIRFRNEIYPIQDLAEFDFTQSELAFFCVGNDLASQYIPIATKAQNIVIDKSSFYRIHDRVPLIVPEVNLDQLADYRHMNIIANPNCNVIPLAVGLKPIYDAVGITRMNVATYQSVSGTGKEAIAELTQQTQHVLNNQSIEAKVYPQQIAFNVLPHIDDFLDNGYTREEMKLVLELQKIFNDRALAINPTTVRVPVYYAHSAAVHIETRDKLACADAIKLLSQAKGVRVLTGQYPYPTPVSDAAGRDFVYIGRIRDDISHPTGLNLWIVADNLRKGAALNALQIAESLVL